MSERLRNHIRSNVVGYVAIFLALSGTAVALPGTNTVDSQDIIDEQVRAADIGTGQVRSADVANDNTAFALTGKDIGPGSLSGSDLADESLSGADVANGSLGGGDVADNSLTGADVNEDSLSRVPSAASATLGGMGRSFSGTGCNPGSSTYIDCGFISVNRPGEARFLLIASTRAYSPSGSGFGNCRLSTSSGVLPGTETGLGVEEVATLNTVTPTFFGTGQLDLGIECNQLSGDIRFFEVRISTVGLSSG